MCSDYLVAKPSLCLWLLLTALTPKKNEEKRAEKNNMNQNVCNDDVYFNVQFAAFNSTLKHTHTRFL